MSQSNLNTTSAPLASTDASARTPLGQTPEASRDQVLSWEAAMGRAEQGAPHGGPGASPQTAGEPGGEWSPMNPKGAPAGGEASAMAGARGPMQPAAEPGAQAQGPAQDAAALPGAQGDPSCAHMSPEELMQRKWDRIAMGLEPGAAAPVDGLGDPMALLDGAPAQAGSGMAQPITLAQPVALGWQSLPLSERPVVDGMTTEELVTERQVEQEHAEDQAYEANGAAAAEQARLTELNTPDTLPERTIESV